MTKNCSFKQIKLFSKLSNSWSDGCDGVEGLPCIAVGNVARNSGCHDARSWAALGVNAIEQLVNDGLVKKTVTHLKEKYVLRIKNMIRKVISLFK